jgi:hypothetical protein
MLIGININFIYLFKFIIKLFILIIRPIVKNIKYMINIKFIYFN